MPFAQRIGTNSCQNILYTTKKTMGRIELNRIDIFNKHLPRALVLLCNRFFVWDIDADRLKCFVQP